MHHIFVEQNKIIDKQIIIYPDDNDDNFNHLKSSLRLKENEEVLVSLIDTTDNFNYMTKTITVDNDRITLEIIDKIKTNELRLKINLYQGLPKKDIFEDIVDKAVELGVYSITPMNSTNCISKIADDKLDKKMTRFNKISKSAAEQSMRSIIPKINNLLDYKKVIDNIKNNEYNLLFYENENDFSKTENILNRIKNDNNKIVNVIIGPEGGFTNEEIEYAKNNNINILSLGKRILRVETATLTALSYLDLALEGE